MYQTKTQKQKKIGRPKIKKNVGKTHYQLYGKARQEYQMLYKRRWRAKKKLEKLSTLTKVNKKTILK